MKNTRIALAALLAAAALVGQAQPPASPLRALPVEQLKKTYLDCERQTQARLIPFGDAAECSIVADELLARGFGGDFNRLLAWWRTQRESAGCRSEAGAALPNCENS